jgi:hypothetical protein
MNARSRNFCNSFIPLTSKEWNSLPQSLKSLPNVNGFKNNIRPKTIKNQNYFLGQRKENIYLSRLRIGCSSLNADLCNNLHVIETSSCLCGDVSETALHYFLHCPLYDTQRAIMLDTIGAVAPINLRTILHGISNQIDDINKRIVEAVHTFLRDSKRFN